MKALIKGLLIAAVSFLPLTLRGQGTIYFSNHVLAEGINARVYYPDFSTPVEGPAFVAQLYVSLTPGSISGLYPVGAPAPFRTGAAAGWWSAAADWLRVVAEAGPGTTVGVDVRVWSLNGGVTYEEAYVTRAWDVWVGRSNPFDVTLGTTESPAYLKELDSFYVFPTTVIPEPTVFALATLGLVLLGVRWHVLQRQ
jgi:hypothetical protein